jgi:hypothetical protein
MEEYFHEITQDDCNDVTALGDIYPNIMTYHFSCTKLCCEPINIIGEIWLDTNNTAMDEYKLTQLGFTHILNCGTEEIIYHKDLVITNIPIEYINLMASILEAVKLLDTWINKNYKILVTSPATDRAALVVSAHMSINRSVTIELNMSLLLSNKLTPFNDVNMIYVCIIINNRIMSCCRSNIMKRICPIHKRHHNGEIISW